MNKSGFFQSMSEGFLSLDGEAIKTMIANSSDFVLILNADLHVEEVYGGAETLAFDELRDLRGAYFEATLEQETLGKFHALIEGASAGNDPRWRQLNHKSDGDLSFPVSYAAVQLDDKYLLLGRDKRETALLQQRLIHAQMTIEQDYERIRQVESRYRVLFETGTDALLILSADTGKILDANS
ncbi:MAG: hypothetical protein AAF245_08350, partial [Pseudomonadota bacterium]